METKITQFLSANPKFEVFLSSQGIDVEEYKALLCSYATNGRRFIRVKPNIDTAKRAEVRDELSDAKALRFEHIDNVYYLPVGTKIANLASYKAGYVYGMDLGSLYIVEALQPRCKDNILDICCAPGAKLMYIADKMHAELKASEGSLEDTPGEKGIGHVIGNDVSKHRLATAGNLIGKYNLSSCIRLMNKDARLVDAADVPCGLDKILVDVECTHDGSLKHIMKFIAREETVPKPPGSGPHKKISKKEQKRRDKQKLASNKSKLNRKRMEGGGL